MEPIPFRPKTDQEVELLLDKVVDSSDVPPLPGGFREKVMAARPFAPWEVRRGGFWKVPAAVLSLLAASSAILGLAPLFRFGPATALRVWGDLLAASLFRPLAASMEVIPLLSRAVTSALEASPGSLPLVLGAALLALGPLVLFLSPLRRHARDAARRP